jgi:hypothetical protein
MKNQLCVYIAFDSNIRQCKRGFEYQDISILLQVYVKALILRNITDKKEYFCYLVLVFKVFSESSKIKGPSLLLNKKIEVLAVNEGVVI